MSFTLPAPPGPIHFVGIGGIGMSGLARILAAWGYRVSGSDSTASPLTDELAAAGMAISVPHTATAAAAGAALVVATAAVPPANPELVAARTAGVPVVKRAALLGLLANARTGIAVAGSHGKSSTCGMLVTALRELGADPTYAIGAVLAATGTNAAPGSGPAMVVEADEYDYSFLQLTPDIAIITNIEYDHPDLFADQAVYAAAFARFVAGMRRNGTLVIAADDPGCRRLLARPDFAPPARMITFGEDVAADWRLRRGEAGWSLHGAAGEQVPLSLKVPGDHMARNAAAAVAALVALRYAPVDAARAVAAYRGVGRRFELKGEVGGITVIDDYAHHPSEIRANLVAAKERFPGRRLWAVFQPHTFSRLRALLPEFGAAFTAAERVMILDVYAAREADDGTIGAADLVALLPPDTLRAASPATAAAVLTDHLAPGDVVLTLGAGTVTETGPALLDRLRARFAAPHHTQAQAQGEPAHAVRVPPARARETSKAVAIPAPAEKRSAASAAAGTSPNAELNGGAAAPADDRAARSRPALASATDPDDGPAGGPSLSRTGGAVAVSDAPPDQRRPETSTGQNAAETAAPPRPRAPRRSLGTPGPTIPDAPHLKVLRDSPMALHTTWRVGGPADLLARAGTEADLIAAVRWGAAQGLSVTVIGGGSNLLVGDGGIRGLVVLARTPGERADQLVQVVDEGDSVLLRVGAPAPLSWAGRYAAERGWAGLDWAVGLPGTVGGATVNNAGAHGTEQKDHLVEVVLLDHASGAVERRPRAWLAPAYRHTTLKAAPRPRPYTVLAAVMRLPKGDPAALVRLADEHAAFRDQTQPPGASGGSTFANPPGDFAGRLLEAAGMKGFRIGGAGFSPKHGNWIVNDRQATAADIRALIATARERVLAEFGIALRQEIEELGEP